MDKRTISFIALVVTMCFGVGFAVIDDGIRQNYAIIGGLLVAILWMSVGFVGRRECGTDRSMQPQDRTPASGR
ncbi:hypothetical protein [Piscicoccus intestinalis]|uniref:hypothetical protein n=1 Tax=Piscicoccus intestinalis TaxID=746033 RepID=UPI000838509D|nr:hypothetical protein [Piscicoccus intestinalis]